MSPSRAHNPVHELLGSDREVIAIGRGAGLGERDNALDWLERAVSAQDVHLVFLPVDPKWDEYRGEARFDAVARPEARNAIVTLPPR